MTTCRPRARAWLTAGDPIWVENQIIARLYAMAELTPDSPTADLTIGRVAGEWTSTI